LIVLKMKKHPKTLSKYEVTKRAIIILQYYSIFSFWTYNGTIIVIFNVLLSDNDFIILFVINL